MAEYSLEEYISDIRMVVAEETEDSAITSRIKPLSKRLAAEKVWLNDAYREVDAEQGFGLHLVHEEKNHDLAVFVIAWAPGKGLKAHNHKTWAVVAGVEGQECETSYRRLDDQSRSGFAELQAISEETLFPGKVVSCMPEDIHSVWNNGTDVAISLHTYGRHLNFTGRSIFDIDQKTEMPCVVRVQD